MSGSVWGGRAKGRVLLAALAWLAVAPAETARAAPPGADGLPPLQPGEVVTVLDDRPELWVVDETGTLHFVGDTRALAGRLVDWSYRLQVSEAQLGRLDLGDPWLSTNLVSVAGTIYQPRWDTGAPAPILYHVQAAGDLALFGIDGENYDRFVLPAAEWERRTGFRTAELPRRELPPLTAPPPPPAPAATAAPPPPPAPAATAAPPPPPAPAATAAPPPPAPAATPAAPPAPPAGAPAAGATSGTGAVRFTVPPGRDWIDVGADLATLIRLRPTGTLQGERVTGVWRRSIGNSPYAYLEVAEIDLEPHPDVENVADLARLKLRFMRNDSDGFQAGDPRPATVAGQPGLEFDTVATRRFPGGTSSRGSVSDADRDRFVTRQAPGTPLTELIWHARDVVTVRDGRGYAFRLYSTGPGVQNDHLGDLAQLVASASFSP